tara:strand:- start:56633 stop:57901 length:1269 start_codon:yes stop_codon:yes gene_type:complete
MTETRIAIIGLGYVGLPLAIAFSKKFQTIGYDINLKRVDDLRNGNDETNELLNTELKELRKLSVTHNLRDLEDSNTYIITVPTPIDSDNQPDLTAIRKSTQSIGSILKKGDTVIYESTVYPGLTEEICVPILEKESKLVANRDFFYGYSPERINPGDKQHRLEDIVKVTSGSNQVTTDNIDRLYRSIIKAGTHKVNDLRVAEAAKVIENIQRDVNIALVNELSVIFNELGIDTEEVLKAAETKWNFHNYRPGLVGGHCIGVDPYYLRHKAMTVGIKPAIIDAGRSINEFMSEFVMSEVIKLMEKKEISITNSNILILGFSFKANVPDYRNTKIVDLYNHFNQKALKTHIYDPIVDQAAVKEEYGIDLIEKPQRDCYDAVILAVGHNIYNENGVKRIRELCKERHVIYDLSYSLSNDVVDGRL